ncbi:two-component sensor histidine kinase [Portibacter lacus]|uniref:Oxygen sensor histidine kinase NreB n=2 Tax=Portibacter lacus TaxID=1099794 RepID=A0AA37SK98_9BACT|nr:two-component sensor histidine kinase [Portibacter lacus]
MVNGQLSLQDSLFLKKVEKHLPIIRNGNFLSQKYLDTLIEIQSNSSSEFKEGLVQQIQGTYWQSKGDHEKTLWHFSKAEQILGQCCPLTNEYINSVIGSGFALSSAGLINYDTTYFIKGSNKIRKGYRQSKKLGNRYNELMCLDFIGDYNYYSAYQVENMDSALYYYTLLEKELGPGPDSSYRFVESKHNMANVYRRLGEDELSEKYFNESIELSSKYGYNDILFAILGDKAEVLEEDGKHKETLELRLKSYNYVLKTNDPEYINRIDRQLYRSYKNLNNPEKALEYLEKYNQGIQNMNKSGALKLQAELEKQLEIDQQELEIARLENKNLGITRNYLILLAGLSLLIMGFMYWAYRRLRKSNIKLTQKNKEILMAQMKGQNIERKRMAGELHDNLNTKIAAVRYRLEAQALAAVDQNKKMFDETLALVNDIYEDVRLISHNLMPETVEEIGLLPSLQKLIHTLNDNDHTKFHLVSSIEKEKDLEAYSYQLYNIIFEMINNILKHSKAKNAWISLSQLDSKVNVTVSDDGQGFDVNENMGGFGLKSINSRVEQLNGHYTIQSNPGEGTKYMIEIPI